jgi:hypothetical protein
MFNLSCPDKQAILRPFQKQCKLQFKSSIEGAFKFMLQLDCTTSAGLTTTKKAKLRRICPAEEGLPPVVQFSVPNTRRKYAAGQWVFICIPKLGILHWHPFSISSASLDQELTLHFVCNGGWTSQVARLSEDNSEMKVCHNPLVKAVLCIFGATGTLWYIVVSAILTSLVPSEVSRKERKKPLAVSLVLCPQRS